MQVRLWIAATVLAAGCAKDVTKDIEDLADRACACAEKKDAKCGKAALDDLVKLAQNNKEARGDESRAKAAATRMARCLTDAGVSTDELMDGFRQLQ